MHVMLFALASCSLLKTVEGRPEQKLVLATLNFAKQVSNYMMEQYQQKKLHYFRGAEGNVWNRHTLLVKGSTVPLLDITFDYAKTNVFNVLWY
jgi:hypothetical protein